MNGKYTDLDLDYKKELLVNLTALSLATTALSKLAECHLNEVVKELWEQAYNKVSTLSDSAIEEAIAAIENNHTPFTEPGTVLIQKFNRI